jgi:hypothetical protein
MAKGLPPLLLKWRGLALHKSKAGLDSGKADAMMRDRRNDMSNLPQGTTKTFTRKRVIINKTGVVWNTWWTVTSDGTLIIDPNYHSQCKAGEWRYIIEREVKTITYEEMGE